MSLTEVEFASLRHTIALRGIVRMGLLPVTILGWGALSSALMLQGASPFGFIFTFFVLAAGFEATCALHAGAERIGRYVQLYYESAAGGPRWETTAMAVGPALPGGGVDPLFTWVFVGATGANLMAAVLSAPGAPAILLPLALHVALLVRIGRARAAAARQRPVELARMSEILKPEVRRSGDVGAGTSAS